MPKRLLLFIPLAVLAACRTTGAVAPEYVQAAETAIHDAETQGAANLADSNSYLQAARENLNEGKDLSNRQFSHRSELALDKATHDAKLASVIAQKSKLDSENAQLSKQLSGLK